MALEARSPSCWSSTYALRHNGSVVGEFSGRWFSGGIEVALLEGRRWRFRRQGFLSSHHYLEDVRTGSVLGECHPAGVFTQTWDLLLTDGAARLGSKGFFNTGFVVVRGRECLADVDRLSVCSNDWRVRNITLADFADELHVGLLYHTILRRRSQQNSATVAATAN